MLTVSADSMNAVYLGLDNPISISVPGIPNERLSVTVLNADATKKNNGTYILNLVHYDNAYDNAFWNGQDTIMAYGDGSGQPGLCNPLVSVDIVGHEFSNAITEYTAGLIYQGESGALNESFSDLLGTSIEAYTYGANNFNWTIGEDIKWQIRWPTK